MLQSNDTIHKITVHKHKIERIAQFFTSRWEWYE